MKEKLANEEAERSHMTNDLEGGREVEKKLKEEVEKLKSSETEYKSNLSSTTESVNSMKSEIEKYENQIKSLTEGTTKQNEEYNEKVRK